MANDYKDELRNTLVDRSMKTSGPTSHTMNAGGGSPDYPDTTTQTSAVPGTTLVGPTAPTGLPAPPPAAPNQGTVPPAWQRYSTGLKMQNAYANNWNPNPILLRLLNGKQ